MAVAFFMMHAPNGLIPYLNSELAVVIVFRFLLYLLARSAVGASMR